MFGKIILHGIALLIIAIEYELTDQAPEKARKSYAEYKEAIDQILALDGATPYDGIIIDL